MITFFPSDFSPPLPKKKKNETNWDEWATNDVTLKKKEMELQDAKLKLIQIKSTKLLAETTFYQLQSMKLRQELGLPEPDSC